MRIVLCCVALLLLAAGCGGPPAPAPAPSPSASATASALAIVSPVQATSEPSPAAGEAAAPTDTVSAQSPVTEQPTRLQPTPRRTAVGTTLASQSTPAQSTGSPGGATATAAAGQVPGPKPTIAPPVIPSPVETPGEMVEVGTPTPVPSPVGIDQHDEVQLYTGVVQVIESKVVTATNVFISPYIGQGEHLDNPDQNTPLPDGFVPGLQSSDAKHTYQAVDLAEVIGPPEDGGKVMNNGIFITLGPITNDPSGQDVYNVRASIYVQVGDGSGSVYKFQRDPSSPSGWKLLSTTLEWTDNQ